MTDTAFKTQRRTCGECSTVFVARKAYGVPGRWPKYCSTKCGRDAKLSKDRNRPRPLARCERCQRRQDCRWDGGRFCSAQCFGIAAAMARGIAESDAEARVRTTLDKDPSITSRTAVRARRGVGEGITRNDMETLTEIGMWDAFTTRETTLGGHLGPDEGQTSVRVPTAVTNKHEWFEANPEWWIIPEPKAVNRESVIRANGNVYPVKVIAFLIAVQAAAGTYMQAA